MRTFKIFLGILLLSLSFMSCKDNFSVDLSDQRFVRLNKTSVSITAGEKYMIKANVDSLGSANKTFKWSVQNPEVGSIEALDNRTAIITGLSEGKTVIKIESTDGEVVYFSDLNVSRDRVIKILAIGNSFSDDAIEHYLHGLSDAAGYKVMIANLYFGGRSLQTHWERASTDGADYQLRVISPDGSRNAFNDMSVRAAIERENWDYISFQEVSQLSGIIDGYQEYLPKLKAFADSLSTNPELKFILHQTWAYAKDSGHDGFNNYERDQDKMFKAIVDATSQAKDLAGMDISVPAGTAIQNGRTSYIGDKFTRDGYHLNLNIGRFTASAAWFEALFGDVVNNSFVPETLSEYDANLAKEAAQKAVANPGQVTVLEDYKYPAPNEFVLEHPLFIDFGEVKGPDMFNHFGSPNDGKISNLRDMNGVNSNFAIEITKPFSGRLKRGLQNVLGLPREVSEDMFFSDGIKIDRSALTISNLNTSKKYTFVLYGSINDDNTQTEFTVIGKNSGSGLLDNDNNLGKVVVVENIEPQEDATITVELSVGPDNKQWAKFIGINAMMILPEGSPLPVEPNNFKLEQPVFLDFGTMDAGKPYFFIDKPTDAPRFDIYDATGTNTGLALSITDRFAGENQSGMTRNDFGVPVAFTQDAFWGERNNPQAGFTLYRLNATQKYDIVFFGSRRDINDNRETHYRAIGQNSGEAFLNTSNNTGKVAIVKGIQPTDLGIIDIRISAGPNNNNSTGYYYINSMIVMPEGFDLPF